MMQPIVIAHVTGIATPGTYLLLGGVLVALVFLTLWREAITTNTSQFFSRTLATLAFGTSRVTAVVFTGAMIAAPSGPPALYVLLNFLCLYLAARSMPTVCDFCPNAMEMGEDGAKQEHAREREEVEAEARAQWRAVKYQAAVFGLTAGLIYAVVPQVQSGRITFLGLITAVLLGATVRVSGAMVSTARTAMREVRPVMFLLVGSLTVSWLLVVAAGMSSGHSAVVFLRGAQMADILALIGGLLSLHTNYIVIGTRMQREAEVRTFEAEKARSELNLLSRVASDMYDDSSSQLRRQRDQSRSLVRRAEDMERMLAIGLRIQQHKNVKELLQMVAELVRENLGFETVIIRVLNERTQSFEPKAYVGLNADAQDTVMNHRISVAEYDMMAEPRSRVGRSYFLKNLTPVSGTPPAIREGEEPGVLVDDQWEAVERLIVPLVDDDAGERTIGYISVEDPGNPDRSVADVIDTLETIATLATIAIRNLNRYREVGEKNEKLKHYADKLSSLNKMKSNFVATISHEFRTPLTSIKAYCETLLKNAGSIDREILKEFLVVIQEESNRLMGLIEDILDFSQMESGAVRFERTSCNLNEIVTVAAGELEKNFEGKRITLNAQLPRGEVKIRAERDLMKQLVINLLHNASKFTPEGGQVWVRLEDEVVSARIIVEDNGIGIPDDQIEKIFDHFHQVDGTATRRHGGTGIGLAICKNIVEWHDGRIWVENVPGRGARFVVVVPKKQAVVRSELLTDYVSTRRFEVERYMELVVELVAELLHVKRASLMMIDDDGKELRIESAIGLDEDVVEHARVRLGESIAGQVAQGNSAFLVRNVENENRMGGATNGKRYESKSFLSVPVRRDGRVIGVINVTEPVGRDTLDDADHALLELFAERVVLALDALSHFKEKSREFEDVRATFKSILDAKRYIDPHAADALSTVLRDVAERMGMSAAESATLRYVFNVYDLGLAKIGHNIIKQPRELTDEDREHLEQHTIVGTDMLKQIEFIPRVRDAVLYHHENYDGSGYPGKLSGDEIPLEARIIRVADTFRALISHRPYQKQYNLNEAVEVIRHRGGTMFDPKVVEVFINSVNRHADRFRTTSSEAEAPASVEETPR
ncbi:MAG: ATP-binding protein [Candidatus Krumholzibacteria bacterium]|nr:ATP-binding protein [Candidatus Krumholzibacteria bacterium]MDH4338019.1 ATP-binding protein [Candidatus Krumholzibacteria bacterium]MDH5270598.1 ATP-binding protein [Candidatus Krumholzibacteria bacterium]